MPLADLCSGKEGITAKDIQERGRETERGISYLGGEGDLEGYFIFNPGQMNLVNKANPLILSTATEGNM